MSKALFYIGCYTSLGNSGIQIAELDTGSGAVLLLDEMNQLENTSFLCISQNKKYLLAVNEDEVNGELGCFDIQNPLKPIFINKQSTLGGSPCHISLTAKKAFVSNYGTGNLSAFSLTTSELKPAYNQVKHTGQGADLDRQSSAHIHSSQLSRNEQFLIVADLGIDALKVYSIVEEQLELITSFALPAGSGPRHLTFNEIGDKLYLGCELNNDVTVLAFNQKIGSLCTLQCINSLSKIALDQIEDQTEDRSYIAEVALSQNGLQLYVSNRGHDSISIFNVDKKSGLLTAVDCVKTGGKFPRHFAISPDQKWLLAANQNSDNLTVFKRNEITGLLTATAHEIAVKEGVCICFV